MKRTSLFVLAVACVALVAAGCGSSKKKSESTQSQTPAPAQTSTGQTSTTSGGAAAGSNLKVSADPSGQLKFDKSSLSAKAGDVTITMDNPSSTPHSIAVKGNGIKQAGNTVQQGGTSKVTVALKPGTYEFYCPVDSHEQAGMKGTLTVK